MRVLLVSVNRFTEPYAVYPLGLDHVAGALRDRHQLKLLDLAGDEDNTPLTRAIDEFGPDVIGFSLRNIDNTDSSDSMEFISDLKQVVADAKACSNAKIVLGGAGFTLFPGIILETVDADAGIVGEGERFARLLEAMRTGAALEKIPGVITRHGGKTSPPPPFEGSCDRVLPQKDNAEFYLERGGMLNLQTKRGCPFKCFYCTYPHIEGSRIRRFDPDMVAKQALGLQRAGAKYLFISDSVFNSDHSHAMLVAQAFKKAGLSIPWGAFFAPLAPPDGFYQTLADCGCTHVEFGTDTLSPRMLKSYKKAFTAEHALAAHRAATEAGLNVAHYFMLGGPGEDHHSVDETLDAVDTIDKAVFFFFCGIRIYPNTSLYSLALEEGSISDDDDLLEPVFYQAQGISPEQIIHMVRERSSGRTNWIVGAGGEQTQKILKRMYQRGRTGPLWEMLIR